jgi:thioredoxin reductase (NADPH)
VSVETTGAAPLTDIECAIIGGGPAGLTAALYLARFRRQVIVIDGQQSRAELIPESHNYPGFPLGVSGVELLNRLRAQAKQYGVSIIHDEVKSLQQTADKFLLVSAKGSIRAATVLLATGVNDRKPEMGDVRAATLAGAVRLCPICDGYEVTKESGSAAFSRAGGFKHALFLRNYTANLTWFVEGDISLRLAQETELSSLHVRCVVDSVSHIKVLPGPRVSAQRSRGRHGFSTRFTQ